MDVGVVKKAENVVSFTAENPQREDRTRGAADMQ
jgi:hypothetical protein